MPRSFKSPASTVFGRRLREARCQAQIPQDRLGVLIGIDESSSSARISRYESGVHEPALGTAEKLAEVLGMPLPYFYCADDQLARVILGFGALDTAGRGRVLDLVASLTAGSPGTG